MIFPPHHGRAALPRILSFLCSLCCLLFNFPAWGASYFIDYSAGSDSAAGTSTGAAWQHCPGDPNATATAFSTALLPGDIVIFKGGVNYVLVTSGIVPASGNATSVVIYDGNSSGAWGSGKAVLTDNNSANSIYAFNCPSVLSNTVFKGIKFSNIGGAVTLPPDMGSEIAAKPGHGINAAFYANVTVSGCYFGQLGYYQNLAPVGDNTLSGQGVSGAGCNGLVITNCEFTQIRDPIQFSGSNILNCAIATCNFHDQMEWAITMLHQVTTYRSNVWIHNCGFTNTDQYYVSTSQNGQWTGYDGGGPHENAIMMYGAEIGGNKALDRVIGDTNVDIYDNAFVTTLPYAGGTTFCWFQDGTSVNVYRNVFINCAANNDLAIGEPATNTPFSVMVANNTFYGNPSSHIIVTGTAGYSFGWYVNHTGYCVKIENNILSSQSIGNNNSLDYQATYTVGTTTAYTNNVLLNYNDYLSDQFLGAAMVIGQRTQDGGLYRLTNSPPVMGWDKQSLAANPLFVSVSPSTPTADNLAVQASSPATGAGLNLTSLGLPGLNVGFDGSPAPSSGPWTIGAYQLGGVYIPPAKSFFLLHP